MASTKPQPAPGDPSPNPRWQRSLRDPYPADPQRTDRSPYTATDAGAGVTVDSLQAWQSHRAEFGAFVRADVTGVAGAAGPPTPAGQGPPPSRPAWSSPTTAAGSWP